MLTGSAACAAALIASLAAAVPASAFEPIEGVWRSEASSGGATLIQQKAPGVFRNVTIEGTRDCTPDAHGFHYLVGDESEIHGGGLDYSAAVVWKTQDCLAAGTGITVSRVISTDPVSYRMASCAAQPGTGAPQFDAAFVATVPTTRCTTAIRIREPQAPVSLNSFVDVPPIPPRCTRQARRQGRSFRLRLSDQANEPVLTADVRLGRKVLYHYEYPGVLKSSLNVRLPKQRSKLSIAIKTTSNKSFTRTRQYASCLRG